MQSMRYDEAVASLFQVPLDQFVAERKRLAGELKAAGDKEGAAKLAKLARPPISAWAVNQLWWRERTAFEHLLETAQRLRDGQLEATAAHRDALAALRAHAAKRLTDAEHGATESTLRRVTQTLSAIAAAGNWEPDSPGALSVDRDPPGFEAMGIANLAALPDHARSRAGHDRREAVAVTQGAAEAREPHRDHPANSELADAARERRATAEAERRREQQATAARAEAAAEMRRAEAQRAKAAAERHRIAAALRTAQGDVAQRQREVVKLERDLASARHMVEQARSVVEGLEDRLAQLDN